ncbi:cytochrome c oxidase subunit II [Halobacteriales archaeon QS_1_68_17]|nr:MAG: cytochrome c oxidase subunit II [Halobacteriales archaeon QS_1_68_17]
MTGEPAVPETALGLVAQAGGLVPRGTRVEVFNRIYWVFLILGTLVGIVVISYMLWKAYKYRDTGERPAEDEDEDDDRPTLGELPTGSGGGKKLFLSFALSTIIVVSLILWTYGTLLYVEGKTTQDSADQIEVTVEGYQFGWRFIYPNGHRSTTLRVPEDKTVKLKVTSTDVFHNFGIPELKVKSDAIPGQETETWFVAEETGNYTAKCYELCGSGHSYMQADVIVMEQSEYQDWYSQTTPAPEENDSGPESGEGESTETGGESE